ncbi:blue copper protein-like [Magnolia sinica]|uniref:blue copper protein-like n=1 Tax=Magnolia sinica TaxID=86752 RepID=UPI00265944A8|nr:blue copper protein-like [Magnolia sinica]
MDSRMGLIGLVQIALVVVAALLQCTAAATTHVVGDSTGWAIPSGGGAQFYINWANGKTFRVGDTLSFAFTAQQHDVAEVTKAEYDACTSTNPIGSILTTSPANVTLNTTGSHYYICAVSGHCAAGQKLTVNVIPSSTTAPSSPPVVPPTPPPAPRVSPKGPSPSPSPIRPPMGPSPSPTSPSPVAPSGPSPPPTSPTNPSPAPMAPTGTPPPPMAPTGTPPAPTGPSSPPGGPTGSPPPPATGGPPAPSSAFSLTASFRSVGFSIAILLISFL